MHPRLSKWLAASYLCLAVLLVSSLGFLGSHADVSVSKQKIFVDGHEYYVKGMVYEPAPLGIQWMNSNGYGGGGFCSAKLTPFDEWKSACYDYDFFDGSAATADRVPAGPSSWFSAVWARDLPVLQELGVNTLRLESLNPLTKAASEAQKGQGGIVGAYGKSHKEFFDACAEANIKIIAPLVSADAGALMSASTATWQQNVKNLLDEVGSHPALLAWVVGSDWGLNDAAASALTARVNEVLDYAKAQGAKVPLTYCVSNLPQTAQFYADNLHIDFLCANAGWDGPQGIVSFLGNASDASSWTAQMKQKGWPILIGEAGFANLNDSWTNDHSTWFNQLWKQVLDEDTQGVVGSVYFEYCDEPYGPTDWKRTLGAVSFSVVVDGINNSTEENIFWTDNVNKKNPLFNSIKEGQLDGASINYNMDIYAYLKRQPETSQTANPTGNNSSDAPTLLNSCLTYLLLVLVCCVWLFVDCNQ